MRLVIADCSTADDEDFVTEMALAEAARGRPECVAARMVDALAGKADADCVRIEEARRRGRAMVDMERMVARAGAANVDLAAWYSRFATLRMFASGSIGELQTSVPELKVDARLARGLAMVSCELLQSVERGGADATLHVRIAIALERNELILAVSVLDQAAWPVPTCAGAAALKRAERLVGSLGGTMSRGLREGEMLFGVVLTVAEGARGAGR